MWGGGWGIDLFVFCLILLIFWPTLWAGGWGLILTGLTGFDWFWLDLLYLFVVFCWPTPWAGGWDWFCLFSCWFLLISVDWLRSAGGNDFDWLWTGGGLWGVGRGFYLIYFAVFVVVNTLGGWVGFFFDCFCWFIDWHGGNCFLIGFAVFVLLYSVGGWDWFCFDLLYLADLFWRNLLLYSVGGWVSFWIDLLYKMTVFLYPNQPGTLTETFNGLTWLTRSAPGFRIGGGMWGGGWVREIHIFLNWFMCFWLISWISQWVWQWTVVAGCGGVGGKWSDIFVWLSCICFIFFYLTCFWLITLAF